MKSLIGPVLCALLLAGSGCELLRDSAPRCRTAGAGVGATACSTPADCHCDHYVEELAKTGPVLDPITGGFCTPGGNGGLACVCTSADNRVLVGLEAYPEPCRLHGKTGDCLYFASESRSCAPAGSDAGSCESDCAEVERRRAVEAQTSYASHVRAAVCTPSQCYCAIQFDGGCLIGGHRERWNCEALDEALVDAGRMAALREAVDARCTPDGG